MKKYYLKILNVFLILILFLCYYLKNKKRENMINYKKINNDKINQVSLYNLKLLTNYFSKYNVSTYKLEEIKKEFDDFSKEVKEYFAKATDNLKKQNTCNLNYWNTRDLGNSHKNVATANFKTCNIEK